MLVNNAFVISNSVPKMSKMNKMLKFLKIKNNKIIEISIIYYNKLKEKNVYLKNVESTIFKNINIGLKLWKV